MVTLMGMEGACTSQKTWMKTEPKLGLRSEVISLQSGAHSTADCPLRWSLRPRRHLSRWDISVQVPAPHAGIIFHILRRQASYLLNPPTFLPRLKYLMWGTGLWNPNNSFLRLKSIQRNYFKVK